MRAILFTIGGVLAAGVLAVVASAGSPSVTATTSTDGAAQPYGVKLPSGFEAHYSAGVSCASSACHGGSVGQLGGEHTTWGDDGPQGDPHRRAYAVLFNDVSQRMVKLLPGADATPAHQNPLCLKCHSVDEKSRHGGGPYAQQLNSEGVSCEACHGPADRWLTEHYQPQWKQLSNREKWDQGFRPTKNLVARISACTECHVGSADREVNHDLIAAGHPRLNFEYTRFHFATHYQRHWEEKPGFELRAWYVGQLASMRGMLALLSERANPARVFEGEKSPWPEFAESSCYACHQSIGREYPRNQAGALGREAGVAPWQTWYTPMADALSKIQPLLLGDDARLADLAGRLPPKLKMLRCEMQKRSPNRDTVVHHAREAVSILDEWLILIQNAEEKQRFLPASPEAALAMGRILLQNVLRMDESGVLAAIGGTAPAGSFDREAALTSQNAVLKDYDWDVVAQHYLGLAAVYHALDGRGGQLGVWEPRRVQLERALGFPKDDGCQPRFNSPLHYRPENAAALLKELYRLAYERNSR